MSDILVVQSKVKELIKSKGCNTSADAIRKLSQCVEECIDKAVTRARENKRKTVKGCDV